MSVGTKPQDIASYKAVRDLEAKIKQLETEIELLKQRINTLES